MGLCVYYELFLDDRKAYTIEVFQLYPDSEVQACQSSLTEIISPLRMSFG
jgi:hypothetical protein